MRRNRPVLACGILSQILFWQVAKRVLHSWAVPFAVGLLSLGIPFIYFSSQVKQYSSDVAASVLLLCVAIEIRRRGVTPARAFWFGIIGALVVWFSQPAAFVLAGLGTALLILVWIERDASAARIYAISGILWTASVSAAALLALRNLKSIDREYFQAFWAEGFMPFPPTSVADVAWLPNKLIWAFGAFASGMNRMTGGLNYRWSAVFTMTMAVGFWALWRSGRNRDVALFVGLPIVVVAALSATKLYPFTARLFVFLLPGLLLATGAGAEQLLAHWPNRAQFLTPAFLAVLGGSPAYAIATALPPFWLQHLRPVVERIVARQQPGDAVYVFYGAGQAFHYYAARYGLNLDTTIMGRWLDRHASRVPSPARSTARPRASVGGLDARSKVGNGVFRRPRLPRAHRPENRGSRSPWIQWSSRRSGRGILVRSERSHSTGTLIVKRIPDC